MAEFRVIVSRVRSGRGTILVQWIEGKEVKRGWIPDHLVDSESRVSSTTLKSSLPYAYPLEAVLGDVTIKVSELSAALHRRGIWTEEDLLKNTDALQKAIIESANLSASRVQSAVRAGPPEPKAPKVTSSKEEEDGTK